jgi:Flp pilus assembly protein TadD
MAVSHMQRGEWEPAVMLLREVVAAVPGNARLHNTLGIALSSAGEADSAAEQFGRALELEPTYPSALKNLALHEMARNRPDAAKPYFKQLLAASGGDAFAHLGLAEIAFAKGDFAGAVPHFEESHGLLVQDPRLLINFAEALLETDQPSRAALALDKLPKTVHPDLHLRAGLMLADMARYPAAAREFELAGGGKAAPYEVGFNLVLAYVKSGQHEKAVCAGEELLETAHQAAELHNLLSQAYEGSGDTKRAYDALRTATGLAPSDESNYVDLIALCLDHENFDLGVEIADISVQRVPGSQRLHLQRGVALAMKGRFDDAEEAFERATELAPGESLPGSALGLILMQQDRLPDAVRVLRARQERAPGDYLVHWFLAEALQRSGVEPGTPHEAEAVQVLRRSVELNPDLFQSRLLLGKMLARRGELDEALEHLERVRAIEPAEVSATYQLALVHRSRGESERAKELFALVGRQKAEDREQFTKGGLLRIVREGVP